MVKNSTGKLKKKDGFRNGRCDCMIKCILNSGVELKVQLCKKRAVGSPKVDCLF